MKVHVVALLVFKSKASRTSALSAFARKTNPDLVPEGAWASSGRAAWMDATIQSDALGFYSRPFLDAMKSADSAAIDFLGEGEDEDKFRRFIRAEALGERPVKNMWPAVELQRLLFGKYDPSLPLAFGVELRAMIKQLEANPDALPEPAAKPKAAAKAATRTATNRAKPAAKPKTTAKPAVKGKPTREKA